jgi:hypothetical protein
MHYILGQCWVGIAAASATTAISNACTTAIIASATTAAAKGFIAGVGRAAALAQ